MSAFGALSTNREALGQNDPEPVAAAWSRTIPNHGLTPTLLRAFPTNAAMLPAYSITLALLTRLHGDAQTDRY